MGKEVKPSQIQRGAASKDDLKFWQTVNDVMYYSRSAWVGVYRGLFTSTAKATVPKPTPKCFGSWITKEVRALDKFFVSVADNIWTSKFEDFRKSWYTIGDLIFENDEYCHFRHTAVAIYDFNIIIQISKTFQTFHELEWDLMDQEERGDAIAQVGRVVATLFADLWGFKPGHKKRAHGIDGTVSAEDEKYLHHGK